jgi:predicted amidophosphoribosyltransferase
MKCKGCGHLNEEGAKFCNNCGKPLVSEKPPYIGESINSGIYRITFDPVEGEFSGKDAAESAAGHSCWNTDSEFDKFKVAFVKSTVPVEEYPYVCSDCGKVVASHTNGRCGDCGSENWEKRKI